MKYFRVTSDYVGFLGFKKRKVYIVAATNVKEAIRIVLIASGDKKVKLRSAQIMGRKPRIIMVS